MAEQRPPEDGQRSAGQVSYRLVQIAAVPVGDQVGGHAPFPSSSVVQRVSGGHPGGGQVFGDGLPPPCGRDPLPQSGTRIIVGTKTRTHLLPV